MKKLYIVVLLFLLISVSGCKDEGYERNVINTVSNYALQEEEASFNFFWETQNTDEEAGGYGLIPDRYPSNGLASIASVGFGLAGFPIGVENEWITKKEGLDRTISTLKNMKNLKTVEGFYYHFYNEKSGNPASGSEISNIDTAIFIAGALVAGEYFGGEAKTLAYEIYDAINWPWYINKTTNRFYMGYNPVTKVFSGAWDVYGEQLMMYFLAAGSKTYPIEKKVYDSFNRLSGTYGGETFIHSWFGSIFTYQFSHSFVDFRNIVDEDGINWFENSVKATKANRQFCIDNSSTFRTFSEDSWGTTACDTPTGYSGTLGAAPSGFNNDAHKNDGTIALAGSIGSMPFAPTEVMSSIKNYYEAFNGGLVGKYGLYDAYNIEKDTPWIASDVIGIDKGVTLLMIENHRSNLVWDIFNNTEFMERAIKVLGFTKTNS